MPIRQGGLDALTYADFVGKTFTGGFLSTHFSNYYQEKD